ncbi:twin-arginine translocase TatA/TatE family subunit [Gulosibacter faecalis]|jgi:sec-independent protein translocase protein TatA|uniref:Sec-independent protein translocase protein TatA n=1 Tax=Gulosibacter faecalis TaxID=272240 RepID=A0ABW5UYZ2_9MICO|nr:twin-arginine translocase TatA/TatE family subunit [Gulosibacter faecalis]
MFANLTGWHALIILAIVVLIFGAAKLPALAKSVGQSMRILKHEVRDDTSASTSGATADARSETSPSEQGTAEETPAPAVYATASSHQAPVRAVGE